MSSASGVCRRDGSAGAGEASEAAANAASLLLDYPPMFGAKAAYLTSTELPEFEIEPTDGNVAYPFTSNCLPASPVPVSYFGRLPP